MPRTQTQPRGQSVLEDDDLMKEFQLAIEYAKQNSGFAAADGDGDDNDSEKNQNFQGCPWKTIVAKDGIKVESSPSSSSDFNLFRSTMLIECDSSRDIEDFVDAMHDFDRRITWDKQIRFGRRLLRPRPIRFSPKHHNNDINNDDDALLVDIIRYATNPAAGGLIKSRLFTDVKVSKRTNTDYLSASMAWDSENHSALGLPEKDAEPNHDEKGMVVATNMLGSCMRVSMMPEKQDGDDDSRHRVFEVTAVGFTNPGGFIPSNLVNSQSAKAFHKCFQRYAKHLGGRIVSR